MRSRPILLLFAWMMCGGTLPPPGSAQASDHPDYHRLRRAMVRDQIAARGINHPAVLRAMERVPRHRFVPQRLRPLAYEDHPLPIGHGQTISQPFIVAYMTAALDPKATDRVLEIGTGSGYQAAVLAELVREVYTIEIIEALGKRAGSVLKEMGYENVHVRIGDGYKGWPEKAPFDAIIVTCAPERIPRALVRQLKEGGRMIIPVGRRAGVQELVRVVKRGGRVEKTSVMAVRFVPMVHGAPSRVP